VAIGGAPWSVLGGLGGCRSVWLAVVMRRRRVVVVRRRRVVVVRRRRVGVSVY